MDKKQVSVGLVVLLCAVMAAAAGGVGYWLSQSRKVKAAPAPEIAIAPAQPIAPAAAPAQPKMTDNDWNDLIGDADAEPATPAFDPEEMEARRKRFESMTVEQRQMMRKAMFAAMAKVDGLEEVGDAIREGKIDPRQFKVDLPAIADRMEIHAETMDQQAMEEEVTKTMQEIVDQARSQVK
jgi:hypothetical protein